MKLNSYLYRNLFFLFIGAVWIYVSAAAPGSTTSGKIPAPQQGFLAPDFTLPDSNGKPVSLSDLRGQPVLLNIWASWCSPCRAEMPAMQHVYETYRSQGFTILAVNAAYQDKIPSAMDFANELGLTFPILFDQKGEISRLYQVEALPTSFFIDAQGIIREVVVGGPMSEALLAIRIQQLLKNSGE